MICPYGFIKFYTHLFGVSGRVSELDGNSVFESRGSTRDMDEN